MLEFSVPIPDLSILRVAAALLSAPVQSLARSDCFVLWIVAAVIALYSLLLLLERLLLGCDPKHQHPAQTPWTVVTVPTNSRKNCKGRYSRSNFRHSHSLQCLSPCARSMYMVLPSSFVVWLCSLSPLTPPRSSSSRVGSCP